MTESRPLFARFPALSALPIRAFAALPTPVTQIQVEGHRLWVKRDDLSHSTYGGNKVRKLEFLLGEALATGCNAVATMGGIGTNHGLATAIFAREAGLACHLALFPQPVTDHVRLSLRLYHAHQARLHHFGSFPAAALFLAGKALTSRTGPRKEKVAVFGPGGSSPLGTLGFVNAGLELKEQIAQGLLPEPRRIYCALGSNGTLAGLTLGIRLAGLKCQVIGVRVTPLMGANARLVAALANRCLAVLKAHGAAGALAPLKAREVGIDHRFYGGTYGLPTAAGLEAAALAAEAGLRLEPTYTAKAFAAALADLRSQRGGPVLFWNTFSSADLSPLARTVDPTSLPKPFHRYLVSVEGLESGNGQAL
jgi:D-cysteine desulfhydrase